MFTRALTDDDRKLVRKLVANSIREDWMHYQQGVWIDDSTHGSENRVLSKKVKVIRKKVSEPDVLPNCGTTCCIAGRAVVVGVQLGLIKKPRLTKDEISITDKTWIGVANEAAIIMNVDEHTRRDLELFSGGFDAVLADDYTLVERAKSAMYREDMDLCVMFCDKLDEAMRKENAARVARLIETMGDTHESQQEAVVHRYMPTEGFDIKKVIKDIQDKFMIELQDRKPETK